MTSNFLIEEADELIKKVQKRIEQQAQLGRDACIEEVRQRGALKQQRLETSLHRLQLYREMLKDGKARRDPALVAERNRFGKQYKRQWRPAALGTLLLRGSCSADARHLAAADPIVRATMPRRPAWRRGSPSHRPDAHSDAHSDAHGRANRNRKCSRAWSMFRTERHCQ